MPRRRNIVPFIVNAAVFIILEMAALHILRNNSTIQSIWIGRGSHRVMAAVWGSSESVRYYFSLRKQNELLAEENFELRSRLAVMDEAGRNSAGPVIEGTYSYLPAQVCKVSRNTQHNYMIIDKGSADGVRPRSGIITARGVAGIIDAVDTHHSYALTVMNSNISISARLGHEGAAGPLSWDGRSRDMAVLREIPIQYRYSPGDTVFTSGYSSIFPPDIPLGLAGESKLINGATLEIKVKLFQDFSSLRFVTVVHNTQFEEVEGLKQ